MSATVEYHEIPATVADLARVTDKQKAEIIQGRIVLMSLAGIVPGRAGGRIYRSLAEYEDDLGGGYAVPDNVGFCIELPYRKSFSPDAAFFTGVLPTDGAFVSGAPVFAAEVRSANEYGEMKEEAIQQKIDDYFAAGTMVVWDVDVLRDGVIRCYQNDGDRDNPTVFHRGEIANAEPAVPGWQLEVSKLIP